MFQPQGPDQKTSEDLRKLMISANNHATERHVVASLNNSSELNMFNDSMEDDRYDNGIGFENNQNEKAGGPSGLLMDLAANEKDVHSDFYNDFGDLFDDDDDS